MTIKITSGGLICSTLSSQGCSEHLEESRCSLMTSRTMSVQCLASRLQDFSDAGVLCVAVITRWLSFNYNCCLYNELIFITNKCCAVEDRFIITVFKMQFCKPHSSSSSYVFLARFLAVASPDWGFERKVSYGVGLLTLRQAFNMEDQNFILGFTPLGTCIWHLH